MQVLAPTLTLFLGAWLVLLVVFPRTWAALLDREYDFLVRKGLLSQSLSDRVRKIEKGGIIPLAVTLLFGVYLATLMIPLQVLIVPLFIEVSRLGLQDTYVALLLPLIASPFGVFLLRQFFLGLPPEIEEAARIDGAGHWQVFTRIVLPMSKPAIATLVVFAFMAAWNSFLWPLVVINSEQLMTLPLGLSQLHGRFATEWNLVMAGSTISVIPIVALYLFTQRYVIQGVALSGLKG